MFCFIVVVLDVVSLVTAADVDLLLLLFLLLKLVFVVVAVDVAVVTVVDCCFCCCSLSSFSFHFANFVIGHKLLSSSSIDMSACLVLFVVVVAVVVNAVAVICVAAVVVVVTIVVVVLVLLRKILHSPLLVRNLLMLLHDTASKRYIHRRTFNLFSPFDMVGKEPVEENPTLFVHSRGFCFWPCRKNNTFSRSVPQARGLCKQISKHFCYCTVVYSPEGSTTTI